MKLLVDADATEILPAPDTQKKKKKKLMLLKCFWNYILRYMEARLTTANYLALMYVTI